ncbi:MAG: transcription termination factor Rho [Trueperaceae bacterium]|nr:transcription termination factor Rho [Trueperaceae bacterium]
MSPRAKNKDADAAQAADANDAPEATVETAPKRRGRPRKVASESSGGDATPAVSGDGEKPAAKPRRKRKADAATEVATHDETSVAAGGVEPAPAGSGADDGAKSAARDDASAGGQDAGAGSDQERSDERAAGGSGKGRKGRGKGKPKADRDDDEEAADARSRDDDSDDDDGDDDQDGDDGRGGSKGNQRKRSRRSRSGGGGQRVNYRDLQTKIVPELHLLAKEVGLEEYRAMEKDDLAVAILERLSEAEGLKLVQGYLEISSDGYGFLQESLLQNDTRKVIVSAGLIKQFRLRTGDWILGKARPPRNNERYGTLIRVEAVNGVDPFLASKRPRFDDLIPTFPETRIRLETTPNELSARVIDLLAPIGRGQRGLIVAPPKAGKTTLLKAIAHSVVTNEPDMKLIVLLVDERPEEVTDFRESVQGVEVVASTFDEPPTNHIRVAQFVHERARRIVEEGGHAMILLDSITRLARANNLVTPPTGRTLSGGLDSSALHWPKRFLGAARNIRGGGSLSILATALVETGSRMDDVIFEEFKGTGNMELHLSRRLEERRIFPAIDILKSGTRREDLLLEEGALAKMWLLRKVISDMDAAEAMEMLLSRLSRTKTNEEFLSTLGQG